MPYSVIPVTGLVLGPIGSISQTDFPLISPRQVNPTDTLNLAFGEPFVLNANNTYSSVAQFILTNGVAALAALANGNPNDPFGIAKDSVETNAYYPLNGGANMPAGFYAPGMVVNGLTRGTISVGINAGTPSGANAPVYLRTVLNGAIPAGLVGQFEAAPDGTLASAANAGNTGNATAGTLALGAGAQNGAYAVIFSSATAFSVTDPYGKIVGTGVAGTPFAGGQVVFTVTAGGTPMVRGDGLTINVAAKTQLVKNIVFKTGVLSVDPNTGKSAAQLTILERKVA
jgi:hypothetical protein